MAHRWFRGNLHTHTTNSDGDSRPEVVVAWYRDAGYDFLALTDHDFVTLPSDFGGVAGPMLLVHGEEVTAGDIHVNALGLRRTILPVRGASAEATLQANLDAIRAADAVPSINHPNFRWQLTPADFEAVSGARLFEVHNAGPETNNGGGRPGHPSTEALWDALLTSGRRLVGIATDDAHHFRVWGRAYSNPGRGWVCIRAERLSEAELLTALEAGQCYASTGVELAAVDLDSREMSIDIAPQWDLTYRTAFVGSGGRVLDVVDGVSPRYRITGKEGYVRARVDDSDGLTAWLQPRFVD
jgi:hypothetical protein